MLKHKKQIACKNYREYVHFELTSQDINNPANGCDAS